MSRQLCCLVGETELQSPASPRPAASGFAPCNDAESAILIARPPGNTTAIVRGKNGGIGSALVEVYRLN